MSPSRGVSRRRPSPQSARVHHRRGDNLRKVSPRSSASPPYAIRISDNQDALRVPAARLRRVAKAALLEEHVAGATLSIALVDNATIRRLNRQYLNHDYATDVLSFLFHSEPAKVAMRRRSAQSSPPGRGWQIDGEVIVSAEMALRTAPRFGWSPLDELTLYLVHGVLHLCGHDDRTASDRRQMRARERAILDRLAVPCAEPSVRREDDP